MRLAQVLTVSVLTLAMTADASAERREGLGGKYAARNMTAAQGSLTLLAGPTSTQALGTFSPLASTGPGFTYNRAVFGEGDFELDLSTGFLNVGAAYGITPELEAGVMLPLLLIQPEGGESDLISSIPVFATYAMDLGNFDAGVRLTASVPISEGLDFGLNVGVPFLFRFGGNSRLDTGLFFPLNFGDELGKALVVPVRFTQSVTPKIFVGAETGLVLPEFETDAGAIPFGIHAGYTLLAGGNVVDIALQLMFPGFVSLAEGAENPGTDLMAISFGSNVQMKF